MSTYLEFAFISPLEEEQKDMLIAVLSGMGFTGFEEDRKKLKAFVPEEDFDEAAFTTYCSINELHFVKTELEEKNWNEEWEKNFEPVIVGDYCAIRADFHQPIANVKHEIIITPKMSFGTGHHATTYMMIQAMQQLDFRDKSVFDFGTGTGVLAILAEKENAETITAIDNDEWSIENAKENLERNNCNKIILYRADELNEGKQFDIILANINRNVILQFLPAMKQHLAKDGVLLLSGLLHTDREIILEEALKNNLKNVETIERNSWICLKMQ